MTDQSKYPIIEFEDDEEEPVAPSFFDYVLRYQHDEGTRIRTAANNGLGIYQQRQDPYTINTANIGRNADLVIRHQRDRLEAAMRAQDNRIRRRQEQQRTGQPSS